MNNETLQALTTLATTLGTTIDHLWSVLATQAHVVALIVSIKMAVMSIISTQFSKLTCELRHAKTMYGDATTLMNPEYWALEQITELIHGK